MLLVLLFWSISRGMKYTWKVFKYSRRICDKQDEKSFCGMELLPLGQSVLHSHFNGQGARRERWLHIFVEDNKTLEVSLLSSFVEVQLNIISATGQQTVILERVELDPGSEIRVRAKQRILGLKHGQDRDSAFQILFLTKEDVELFSNKLIEIFNINAMLCRASSDRTMLQRLQALVKDREADENVLKTPAYKSREELIEEFLLLLERNL